MIRRLHSTSWLSAVSNLAANLTLEQTKAQMKVMAYPSSCVMLTTGIEMLEIISELRLLRVRKACNQEKLFYL